MKEEKGSSMYPSFIIFPIVAVARMMKSFIYLLTQVSGIAASCYDNWFDLMADVEDAEADQEFVVCPGTDLIPEAIVSGEEVFTDIWIYQSGTRLLCGENGESNNMCKFKGGQSHLYISDDDIEGVFVSVSRTTLSLLQYECLILFHSYSNALHFYLLIGVFV